MRKLIVALALLGSVAAGLPAHAATPGAVVVTAHFTFVPGDNDIGGLTLTMSAGTELEFVNADIANHSVTSDIVGKFDSGTKSSGSSGAVTGTASLAPGTYGFHCKIHPTGVNQMIGTLIVT